MVVIILTSLLSLVYNVLFMSLVRNYSSKILCYCFGKLSHCVANVDLKKKNNLRKRWESKIYSVVLIDYELNLQSRPLIQFFRAKES